MKHIFHLTFALLAGMAVCACSSDDPIDNDQTPVPVQPGETGSDDTWGVKIEGDMTRGLSPSNPTSTLTPNFNGENIYVYYNNTKVGTLTAPSGTGDQVLTGRLNNDSYTKGQSLSLYFLKDKDFATYTGQQGTIANIASYFDYATATAEITGVDVSTHTLTISKATFTSQQAIVGLKFSEALNKSDVITISGGGLKYSVNVTTQAAVAANSGVVYVALPLNTASSTRTFNFTIARKLTGNSTTTNVLKGSITGAAAMTNGKYYSTKTVTLIKHMALATTSDLRKAIDSNGYIYDSGNTSITRTGIIVYVNNDNTGKNGTGHGYAMSRGDRGLKRWSQVADAVSGTTPSPPSGAGSWALPSLAQWNTILIALKGGSGLADRKVNSLYQNVDIDGTGTGHDAATLSQLYWSSTSPSGSSDKWCYRAGSNYGYSVTQGTTDDDSHRDYVRPIYAF